MFWGVHNFTTEFPTTLYLSVEWERDPPYGEARWHFSIVIGSGRSSSSDLDPAWIRQAAGKPWDKQRQ